jgi:hypothetical protein
LTGSGPKAARPPEQGAPGSLSTLRNRPARSPRLAAGR